MKNGLLVIFITLIWFNTAYSQNNTTSRLRIESGGSIYFNFNSLDKYENGLEYTNWTRLTVYFNDTTAGPVVTGMKWKLDVKAMSANIIGDAGNTIPLKTIELEATSNDLAAVNSGILELTNADASLITNGSQTDPGITEVFITYYCGQSKTVSNKLMGTKPDYYFVDIMLTLRPE